MRDDHERLLDMLDAIEAATDPLRTRQYVRQVIQPTEGDCVFRIAGCRQMPDEGVYGRGG